MLIKHLEKERPDLVEMLIQRDKKAFDQGMHGRIFAHIIDYFRNKFDQPALVPPTRLGMLDLLFELWRRVHKSLGKDDLPVFGKPFAVGINGPFPTLINKPIALAKKEEDRLSQELVDEVIQSAYRQAPEIFYEFSEQIRRVMYTYEINGAVNDLIKSFLQEKPDPWSTVLGSAQFRLRDMCAMPSGEVILERLK